MIESEVKESKCVHDESLNVLDNGSMTEKLPIKNKSTNIDSDNNPDSKENSTSKYLKDDSLSMVTSMAVQTRAASRT